MTYCVAISVNSGIVFCSDSRTNAGVDQVSTYSKMYKFDLGPERQFVILSAGNLATTQGTLRTLKKDIREDAPISLKTVANIGDAADYLGSVSCAEQKKHSSEGSVFEASFLLGGQISGGSHRVVMIYPEGNHITSSKDTPYLQIGESKYGKPILDRIINVDTTLDTSALCALVSMDSTMQSNLSVGPPIELQVYHTDSFNLEHYIRFNEDSEFLRDLKKSWDNRLKEAFRQLPPLAWANNWKAISDNNSGVY